MKETYNIKGTGKTPQKALDDLTKNVKKFSSKNNINLGEATESRYTVYFQDGNETGNLEGKVDFGPLEIKVDKLGAEVTSFEITSSYQAEKIQNKTVKKSPPAYNVDRQYKNIGDLI